MFFVALDDSQVTVFFYDDYKLKTDSESFSGRLSPASPGITIIYLTGVHPLFLDPLFRGDDRPVITSSLSRRQEVSDQRETPGKRPAGDSG